MKENKEIYNESLSLVKEGKWGLKFFAVMTFFTMVTYLLLSLLQSLFNVSVPEFTMQSQNGDTVLLKEYITHIESLSIRQLYCVFGGELLLAFIRIVLSSAIAVGVSRIALNIVKGDYSVPLFKDILCGIPQPFSMFWLYFRVCFGIFARILVALIPVAALYAIAMTLEQYRMYCMFIVCLYILPLSIYAFAVSYRYRLAWFAKADNMDKSANWCVRQSIKLMNGNKKRLFCLDCRFASYFLLFMLCMTGISVAVVCSRLMGINAILETVRLVAGIALLVLIIRFYFRFIAHFNIAMAKFYKELQGTPNES